MSFFKNTLLITFLITLIQSPQSQCCSVTLPYRKLKRTFACRDLILKIAQEELEKLCCDICSIRTNQQTSLNRIKELIEQKLKSVEKNRLSLNNRKINLQYSNKYLNMAIKTNYYPLFKMLFPVLESNINKIILEKSIKEASNQVHQLNKQTSSKVFKWRITEAYEILKHLMFFKLTNKHGY